MTSGKLFYPSCLVSSSVTGGNNKAIIRFELVTICKVLKIASSTFLWLDSQSIL